MRVVRKRAKRQGAGQRMGDGTSPKSSDKVKGDGETLGGFNRRTGLRNRRYNCDTGYHLAPKCARRDVLRSEIGPAHPGNTRAHRPTYSAISMEAPVAARVSGQWKLRAVFLDPRGHRRAVSARGIGQLRGFRDRRDGQFGMPPLGGKP